MARIENQRYVLLFAAVMLVLLASACALPGSTSPPVDLPSPTREAGVTDTPVAAEPTESPLAPTATSSEAQPTVAPTQPPAGGLVRQWAVGATASSEYSTPEWSAQQAIGAPDTTECGDNPTAWASETPDGVDWLEVSFATAVVPTEINIHETYSPGFIARVEVKDERGLYHTVWEGAPGMVEQCPRVLTIPVSGVDARVNAVRINLDQRGEGYWNEIDAVELVGRP